MIVGHNTCCHTTKAIVFIMAQRFCSLGRTQLTQFLFSSSTRLDEMLSMEQRRHSSCVLMVPSQHGLGSTGASSSVLTDLLGVIQQGQAEQHSTPALDSPKMSFRHWAAGLQRPGRHIFGKILQSELRLRLQLFGSEVSSSPFSFALSPSPLRYHLSYTASIPHTHSTLGIGCTFAQMDIGGGVTHAMLLPGLRYNERAKPAEV